MAFNNVFMKDPGEDKFDFAFDWSGELMSGETIQSYTLTVPAGLTEVSRSNTATEVKCRLSGGTLGKTYRVVCQILTSNDRDPIRSVFIKMVQK